jgi:ABC-type antimicrobial peptide transport system permease subunit
MADGVRPEQVEAELDTIATQLAEAYPDTNGRVRMWVQPMMQRTLGGISSTMAFLLVVVGLVLLIACANVASMLLARGMNRSGEFAIRASMGAGRRRLARQLLTESLLLAIIGGMTGVAMAYWGVDALKAVLPDSVPRVAGVALLLIVAGTYGVVSYAVSQRTQEIGVRMTLGADKAGVRRLFLARVAVLFGFGLAIGALGALASASMTRSMVFGISALSPVHMLGAAVVMIVVALGATLVPVRRATGVDPLVALRSD